MDTNILTQEEQLSLLRQIAYNDFKYFCKLVYDFELPKHCQEWIEFIEENPSGCVILAPKDFFKSRVLGHYYPVWRICRDRNERVLYGTYSDALTSNLVKSVAFDLENNELLIKLFGRFKPDNPFRWAISSEIEVLRTMNYKDPTFVGTSVEGSCIGRRSSLLCADDILSIVNTRTKGMREKVKTWFLEELYPTLIKDGICYVDGTRKHKDDLYAYLIKEGWPYLEQKAILDFDKKIVLYPEEWSFEKLMERKKVIGEFAFNLNYLNQCYESQDAFITEEELNEFSYLPAFQYFPEEGATYYGAVDFSILDKQQVEKSVEKGEDPDYFSIWVFKISKDKDYAEIVYHRRERGLSFEEQHREVILTIKRYLPNLKLFHLESDGFQVIHYNKMKKKYPYLPIKDFYMREKKDPIKGLPGFFAALKSGFFRFPNLIELEAFREEATSYPNAKHDDTIASLYSAWRIYVDELFEREESSETKVNIEVFYREEPRKTAEESDIVEFHKTRLEELEEMEEERRNRVWKRGAYETTEAF